MLLIRCLEFSGARHVHAFDLADSTSPGSCVARLKQRPCTICPLGELGRLLQILLADAVFVVGSVGLRGGIGFHPIFESGALLGRQSVQHTCGNGHLAARGPGSGRFPKTRL